MFVSLLAKYPVCYWDTVDRRLEKKSCKCYSELARRFIDIYVKHNKNSFAVSWDNEYKMKLFGIITIKKYP